MTRTTTEAADLKQVTVYIDRDTYVKIEQARGIYSRSSFIATVLNDVFEDVPECNMEA